MADVLDINGAVDLDVEDEGDREYLRKTTDLHALTSNIYLF